jgi:hypothetical protein
VIALSSQEAVAAVQQAFFPQVAGMALEAD